MHSRRLGVSFSAHRLISACSQSQGEGSDGPASVPGWSSLLGGQKIVSVNLDSRNIEVLLTGSFRLVGDGFFFY